MDPECVEWIPAEFEMARIWVLHVVAVQDAVDEASSELERLPSGRVMSIKELRIAKSRLRPGNIFRLGAGLETWFPVVTEDVKRAIDTAGLKGFCFRVIDTT
jgi:hypothetical protein